jgi:molybdopterin-binding protein
LRGATTVRAARAGAGTVWAGSAFDLAQGLEITVFETRMSVEDLDELFR